MLCVNGHNNAADATFCEVCGSNTFQTAAVARTTTNGMAIASMVLGITWVWWIGSILALVFGYIAKRQIRERGQSGGGMATAGLVLGWIGVGFFIAYIIVVVIVASRTG